MDQVEALARRLVEAGGRGRTLAALAGPPGAGKSTLAEAVVARVEAERPGLAALVPMDGFHFDDAVLEARGRRPFKGAPDTFDVGGLAATLARLKAGEEDVAVPVFDRALEIARAGARIVPASARVVLAEGNYLLLEDAPWSRLAPLFDLTAFIRVDEATLRARLLGRWLGHGLDAAEAERKAESNDLPNGRLVLARSRRADVEIDGTA